MWDDSAGDGLVFRNADGSPISPNALSNHFKHLVTAAILSASLRVP